MAIFLLFILPFFVLNYFYIKFPLQKSLSYTDTIIYCLKSNENEYNILYGFGFYLGKTYLLTIDSKTNEIISDEYLFGDKIYYFYQLSNYVNVYTFGKYMLIDYNENKGLISPTHYLNLLIVTILF